MGKNKMIVQIKDPFEEAFVSMWHPSQQVEIKIVAE